jgi:cytochrome c biogenesis protein CcmG, thiol:disulfide interchange protein DsbE
MKSQRRLISNFVLISLLVFFAVTRLPQLIQGAKMQGQRAPVITVSDLTMNEKSFPPHDGKPAIGVFWATWCGPCTLELSQFRSAVNDGKLDPSRIYAISIGEEPAVVEKAARERHYPFQILLDLDMKGAEAYKVSGTPTIVNVTGDGKIAWHTTGLSPTAVWRAQRLFNK